MVRIFLMQGFRLLGSLIDIVLTFEFGHNLLILKMVILDKVDNIEIEPALRLIRIPYLFVSSPSYFGLLVTSMGTLNDNLTHKF